MKFSAKVKLLCSDVSPFGEVFGKLNFTWQSQTSLAMPTSLLYRKNFTKKEKRDEGFRTSHARQNTALHIIAICDDVDTRKGRGALVNQVIRSATSIGANIHEANYASSKSDFINKFHIALKECAETEYWIEMMMGCNAVDEAHGLSLLQECGVIRRMLVKSITTAKNNKE